MGRETRNTSELSGSQVLLASLCLQLNPIRQVTLQLPQIHIISRNNVNVNERQFLKLSRRLKSLSYILYINTT